MKGKILDPSELAEEMRDRLQIFEKLYSRQMEACRKVMEESKEKYEWDNIQKVSQPEVMKIQDPSIVRLAEECAELNTFIEKQRSSKENQEKLSDDQVNSNSDDSVEGKIEGEENMEKVRSDSEAVEESIYEMAKR